MLGKRLLFEEVRLNVGTSTSLKAEIDGRRRKEEEGGEEGNKVRAQVQATSDGARQ